MSQLGPNPDILPPFLPEQSSERCDLLLDQIASEDVNGLKKAAKSYGDSWCKRGGIGAFMMLARKWDRLEQQAKVCGWDLFHAIRVDNRAEGIIDDLRDLRRYLLLVEELMRREGAVAATTTHRDNEEED